MKDPDVIVHIGSVIGKLIQRFGTVFIVQCQPLKQLINYLLVAFMEQAAENRLSLYGVKIIHDHLVIMAVSFAWHEQKLILFIAETDVL